MKLEKLATALAEAKARYDLDGLDLMLINTVLTTISDKGTAPIMGVLEGFTHAAQGTTHSRLTRLLDMDILAWEPDEQDRRIKNLVSTDLTDELIAHLAAI